MDDIRRAQQDISAGVFDEMIKESQLSALGTEWTDMKKKKNWRHASYMKLDDKTAQLALSPYINQEKPSYETP